MARDGNGVTETTEYELAAVVLINSSGKETDIKFIVQDLNIYQSIYSNTMSADLVVNDTLNLPSTGDMNGQEYIYIKLSNPELKPIEKYFRVYKISDFAMKSLNASTYTLHLCSEEFVYNQQLRVSKSYKDVETYKIIYDICNNFLHIPSSRTFVEQTSGIHAYKWEKNENPIIVPNMKPLEAINWLASFAFNKTLTSAFVFFENQYGFNFCSMEKLVKDSVYKKISLHPKNVMTDTDNKQELHSNPDKAEIKQLFNILETQATGGFSSNMIRLDLIHQEHKFIKFDPKTNSSKHLNPFIYVNNSTNRTNKTLLQETAYTKLFPIFQGDLTDKWLLQRASQFSLLNGSRMNIQIPGDCQLSAGAVLEIEFPLLTPKDESANVQKDPYISGKYLVTSVRHRVINNKYFCYVEICRDSVAQAYPSYAPSGSHSKAKVS